MNSPVSSSENNSEVVSFSRVKNSQTFEPDELTGQTDNFEPFGKKPKKKNCRVEELDSGANMTKVLNLKMIKMLFRTMMNNSTVLIKVSQPKVN